MLEGCRRDTRQKRRVVDHRTLATGEWTPERNAAWDRVRQRLAEPVPLCHPREGYQVLVLPDASDSFWGEHATQVSVDKLSSSMSIADVHRVPLGFVSCSFK